MTVEELPSGDYNTWKRNAAENHCDIRVGTIGRFRYLADSVGDPHATVSATRNQADPGASIVRIDYRAGRRAFTLSSAESWGEGREMTVWVVWTQTRYQTHWHFAGLYRTRYAAMHAFPHVTWPRVREEESEVNGTYGETKFRLVRETLND